MAGHNAKGTRDNLVAHLNRVHQENRDYGKDCDKTKLVNEHNTQKSNTRITNNGEPVVVISNLDSEHDITTMMDELLLKNEFSDTSSIFLLVPSSDDNDLELSPDCSTICIQLSKHQPSWNQKQRKIEDPEISSKRILSSSRGLKISTKGKQYFAEEIKTTVESSHNKDTMSHPETKQPTTRQANICSQKVKANEKTTVESSHNKEAMSHPVTGQPSTRLPTLYSHKVKANEKTTLESSHNKEAMSHPVTGQPSTRLPTFCSHKVKANEKTTLESSHNKEAMSHPVTGQPSTRLPNICSHKVEASEKRKSKLCQITTPDENVIFYHGVSTDTTSDRPCCCDLKLHVNDKYNPEHECVANVVSGQIPPLIVMQGQYGDSYSRLPKVNVIQQASFVTNKRRPTPVTPCVIPPRRGYDESNMLEAHCETPVLTPCCGPSHCEMHKLFSEPNHSEMHELLGEPNYSEMQQELSIEPNQPQLSEPDSKSRDEKHSETCQCSPEKIKEMFEQVLRGKAVNFKTTGCGGAADDQQTNQATKPAKSSLKYSHNNYEDLEQDHRNSIKGKEECGNYPNQNINENTKCACSGRERTIRIGSLCPCEQYPPPVSMTTFGPNMGTRSLGCQCCGCDDSMVKDVPCLGKLDPARGVCNLELGGTACQAQVPKKISKGCVCGSNGKKKKNVICECPLYETKPVSEYDPDVDAYINHFYSQLQYEYESYHYIDEKQNKTQNLKLKSDMTQTQSGFKVIKKKRKQEQVLQSDEEEFTMEDAVRYYVAMNPDLLKEYYDPPPPPEPKECPCPDLLAKKSRNPIASLFIRHEVQCECPPSSTSEVHRSGGTSARAATHVESVPEPVPEPKPEDEIPSGGLKFSVGGKGSGSKGLSGVCCFNMIEETNISRTQSFQRNLASDSIL